ARGGIDGEFGRPIGAMREEDGERIQDFEHGRLVTDLVDATEVRWEPVANPSALLPPDARDTILVSHDGTAWYVDDEMVRHWVPTGNDYACTKGLGPEAHLDIPAQAIVTLTAGEPFRC